MKTFLANHGAKSSSPLSCFDRVIFKGYLPLTYARAVDVLLYRCGLLIKDFKRVVPQWSDRLVEHARAFAKRHSRPFRYLQQRVRKEDLARQIAETDRLVQGLVAIFMVLEPCQSFRVAFGESQPRLVPARRKCRFLYFYFLDRDFGLMHVRIQTWLPFTVQIYVNGHEWLAQQLDHRKIRYGRLDNAFTWIADPARAQQLADRFARQRWARVLGMFARRVNPLLKDLLADMNYYWVADQAEYATDLPFRERNDLQALYPALLQHATLCFGADDIMTFLGRKLTGNFQGEIGNDYKGRRHPGARVKHRMKENTLKMYDKGGIVLRVETVINRPGEFKVRRRKRRRDGRQCIGRFPLTKGVAYLWRYAEVARAANHRYLDALAAVPDPADASRLVGGACEPATYRGRRCRPLNPLRAQEQALFRAVLRGEHLLGGFRNRDLVSHLYPTACDDRDERRRRSVRISRMLQLLRAHRLIAKLPNTQRYRVTAAGRVLMVSTIYFREQDLPDDLFQATA